MAPCSGRQNFWLPLPRCSAPFPSRVSGPGSQRFVRPLHRCVAPFPSRASGSDSQRFARILPACGVPFLSTASGPGSQRFVRPLHGCGAPFPSAGSGPGSQRFGALSPVRCTFSLRGPSASHRSGLRKSSDRNRGLFAGWEGVASLGLSLSLFPPPCLLPPVGMGRLFSGVSQSLCFVNHHGVFGPVNFSLLSHSLKKAPSNCSQGLWAGPYPKQCRPLLSVSPPLAVGRCRRLGYFSAGSCF